MKYLFFTIILFICLSCKRQSNDSIQQLQTQIQELQKKLEKSYKPGFGEIMSSIQVHHNKLWFAGINQNWDLAKFNVHEISESIEDIQTFCAHKPATKEIEMIEEPLANVEQTIEQRDVVAFKSRFLVLTQTCNKCHQATDHPMNVITIPTTAPFSNQVFEAPKRIN